jgi:hypothetical protein
MKTLIAATILCIVVSIMTAEIKRQSFYKKPMLDKMLRFQVKTKAIMTQKKITPLLIK